MNKYFKFGAGVLLLSLVATVSASSQPAANQVSFTDDEKAWILEHPLLRVPSSTLYAPFDFLEDGLPAGLSIDYVKLIAQKVGLKVEYIKYKNSPESLEGAMNKEVDLIHSSGKTPKKESDFLFSQPYFKETFANYGRTGSEKITNIVDLKKLRIGIVKSHVVGDVYKNKYPDFDLTEYDNYMDVKSALLLNEVDVFTGNHSIVEFFITHHNVPGLEKIGDDFVMGSITNDLHIAVQKDNQMLMNIISKGMSLVSDDELRAITKNWAELPPISYDINLTAEEQAWILKHGAIKVSNNMLNAPFDFVVAGQPAGISIDYLNLLARKVGLKIDYVNFGNFPSVLDGAMNNEVDMIHSISRNLEREKSFLFSEPYMEVSLGTYGRIGSDTINSVDDLVGKRVGVLEKNFITEAYRQSNPDLNLIALPNYREAIYALTKGEIDVFSGDVATIEYYISLNNIQGITIIGNDNVTKDKPFYQHFAVQKDSPMLVNIINKAMASVTDDEFDRITEKWMRNENINHDIGLTQAELNWLADNKIIITASARDNAPYDFINENGKIDGLYGDYLYEISRRLNIQFVWASNESWNEGLQKIISSEADVVTGATRTANREEYLLFSEMFVGAQSAIYSHANGIHFANMESLRGYTVAEVRGTADIVYLKENYPDIEIVEVDSINEAIELLSTGVVDAYTGDNLTTSPAILKANIDNLIISGVAPYNFGNGLGIRKDLPLLASSIQKAITDINLTRRQEIFHKWTLLRFIPSTDYGYLWNVLAIALVIIFITLIWNGKLAVARRDALASKNEAEKANEAKTRFLADVSHELRTPLNSLLLLSQNMLENRGKNLTDKQVGDANIIHDAGSDLLQSINGLLDLSKVEANKVVINVDEINIQKISEYLYGHFQPQMDAANLKFNVTIDDALPEVFINDKQYLFQILKNFLSNALKFTEQGSVVVTIKLHISPDDNNEQVMISVTDTGIGIEEYMQQKIFDEFSQGANGISRKYGGTGLGLTISKRIARLMGGNITVNSSLENGSTFNLFLPLIVTSDLDDTFEPEDFLIQNKALAEAGKVNGLSDNEKELVGKTILLVDDDERNLYSLSEVLNKYGIQSILAESGIKALEILKNNKEIDLILMDMMMPGMDGDEAISRIRFMERGEHLPVIFLTANAMPAHRQKCLDAGANDYLTKPIDIDVLLSKMSVWL